MTYIKKFSTSKLAVAQSLRDTVASRLYTHWQERLTYRRNLDLSLPPLSSFSALIHDSETVTSGFGVDDLIAKAVAAIESATTAPIPWLWSDPTLLAAGSDYADSKLYMPQLEALLLNAPALNALKDLLNLPPFDEAHPVIAGKDNREIIPPDWQAWLLDSKQYIESADFSSTNTISPGTYPAVMDPKSATYPKNSWMRVFGSGGWTTEGPCGPPPL